MSHQFGSSCHFSDVTCDANYGKKKLRLVELNDKLLGAVTAGETIRIIGGEKDDAVLCSNNLTFGMKKVETSNQVFFVKPPSVDQVSELYNIVGSSAFYYELSPATGEVDKIHELLSKNLYCGKEFEEESVNRYTRVELEDLVKASHREIEDALRKLNVVEISGYLRMVSTGCVFEVTRLVLDTINENISENNWSLSNISRAELNRCLPTVDSFLLDCSLASMGMKKTNADDLWELNQELVNITSAHTLFDGHRCAAASSSGLGGTSDRQQKLHQLSSFYLPWEEEKFLQDWWSRTPGMDTTPTVADLKGVAVICDYGETKSLGCDGTIFSVSSVLRYLPVDGLSNDPKVRFSRLFEYRPKTGYLLEEIDVYVANLVDKAGKFKSVGELLLHHCHYSGSRYLKKAV